VLLLAALSQGTTTIHDLLDSDDTRVMLAGLKQLGCSISPDAVTPGQAIDVTGIGGQLPPALRPRCSWAMPARPCAR
jgi:3-phosphoshikimate 1-carboxyvinyltransferase